MGSFWTFARRMWRYRLMVVLALVCATFGAGSLGTGLVALQPALTIIDDRDGSLQEMVSVKLREAQDLEPEQDLPGYQAAIVKTLPTTRAASFVGILAGVGLLAVFGGVMTFLHQFFALTAVHRTTTIIRRDAFRLTLRTPLARMVVSGPTDAISRIIADTSALEQGFRALVSKAVSHSTKGAAGLAAAFYLDWKLTAIALAVAPPIFIIIRKLGKKIKRASRQALRERADMLGAATESMQALRVVKAYGAERYESGRFHRLNKEVLRQHLRVRTARSLASPLVEVLTVLMAGVLVAIAGKAIMDGHLDEPTVVAVLAALAMAGSSLKPLTGLMNDIQASAGAAERLEELLAVRPEPGHEPGLAKLPRHAQSLRFESVSFAYPGAQVSAVDGVTLEIGYGETVAFVGPNGSGKTTLLSLVPRLLEPDSGRVLLDGLDSSEASVKSLRSQIAVVTQETVLFAGTIRTNIAYGAGYLGDDEIIAAAKQARAWDFIERLPDGLDTPVGEQGLTLSGGQRQRIAIARAVLRDPAVLILDEATSMIDADSEAKINEALEEFGRGRTCLIVAHRLSTVLGADRIVVMDRGRVVDAGSHDELLERCDTYKLIARTQLVGQGRS